MTLQLLTQLSLLYCAAAVVVAVAVVMIGEDQLMRGNFSSLARFISSSCPFHTFWNWLGRLLPCPAVAAEEPNSLQAKLMLLPPLADVITSLADMPFSRHSQNNARARAAVGPREDG